MLTQAAAGLFLDPGLGKTSICLAAFKVLKDQGLVERMLIIAPLRPCYFVWPNEIDKWLDFNDLTYTILHGKEKADFIADAVDGCNKPDIYIINPEGLQWLVPEMSKNNYDYSKIDALDCQVLCIDESTKFKNSQSKRFKTMRKIFHKFKRRWCLTGTPSPNGLMDLFGQIFILDGGNALGSYITHYRLEYFHRDEQNPYDQWSWYPNEDALPRISEAISPLVLRLNAKDHIDMPDLVHMDKTVDLPPRAMTEYKRLEADFYLKLGNDEIVALNAAALGTKLRQIANGAVYTGTGDEWAHVHDAKLDGLEDLLGEIDSALILYEYIHDKERIQKKFNLPCLNDMNMKQAGKLIDRFNAGVEPYILAHPAGAGHGLNLQEHASHIIWFGITWNLELYDQSIARIWRQGQRAAKVYNYHIVAKDTLDYKVMQTLTRKAGVQRNLGKALQEHRDVIC